MSVQEHAGNEKSCVWHATDFADGELKDELFCIRFASVENCISQAILKKKKITSINIQFRMSSKTEEAQDSNGSSSTLPLS